MRSIENTPRLSISKLRTLDDWPTILKNEEVTVTVEHDGRVNEVRIALDFDMATFGRRSWLTCPECGSRRKHLFFEWGELKCRCCLKLLYFVQALPGSSWRNDVAIQMMRATDG